MTKNKLKNKQRGLQKLFDSFPTHISLANHDEGWAIRPKAMQKRFKKIWGQEQTPSLYFPIIIQWSEKGRGFGEYAFWQLDGQIFCNNGCDSKETIKRILCQMVDQAIFMDPSDGEKVNPEHRKLINRERLLFCAAIKQEQEKSESKKSHNN